MDTLGDETSVALPTLLPGLPPLPLPPVDVVIAGTILGVAAAAAANNGDMVKLSDDEDGDIGNEVDDGDGVDTPGDTPTFNVFTVCGNGDVVAAAAADDEEDDNAGEAPSVMITCRLDSLVGAVDGIEVRPGDVTAVDVVLVVAGSMNDGRAGRWRLKLLLPSDAAVNTDD